jgi:hypothetical protein
MTETRARRCRCEEGFKCVDPIGVRERRVTAFEEEGSNGRAGSEEAQ